MEMEQWARVRRKVLIEGRSKRSVMKEEGLHWETLQKMLAHSRPPGYRRVNKPERKIELHREWVSGVLDSDREMPRKQRHTAKRIWERLRDERGFEGGYTAVKEVVAEFKAVKREVFVPLIHRPGEAQVDFGHALARCHPGEINDRQARRVGCIGQGSGEPGQQVAKAIGIDCTLYGANVDGFLGPLGEALNGDPVAIRLDRPHNGYNAERNQEPQQIAAQSEVEAGPAHLGKPDPGGIGNWGQVKSSVGIGTHRPDCDSNNRSPQP